VKILEGNDRRDWYASVRVQFTGTDGKASTGWVRVAQKGHKLCIDDWDGCGSDGAKLFDFLVASESETIISAVREKIDAGRL